MAEKMDFEKEDSGIYIDFQRLGIANAKSCVDTQSQWSNDANFEEESESATSTIVEELKDNQTENDGPLNILRETRAILDQVQKRLVDIRLQETYYRNLSADFKKDLVQLPQTEEETWKERINRYLQDLDKGETKMSLSLSEVKSEVALIQKGKLMEMQAKEMKYIRKLMKKH